MDEADEGRAGRAVAESPPPQPPALRPVNEVRLAGKVAAAPEERTLPSGAQLVVWRLVVPRPRLAPGPVERRAATVDTLDCVAWTAAAREAAGQLAAGDAVEVHGALRRRFWRTGSGTASRCEVEVDAVVREPPCP